MRGGDGNFKNIKLRKAPKKAHFSQKISKSGSSSKSPQKFIAQNHQTTPNPKSENFIETNWIFMRIFQQLSLQKNEESHLIKQD